jgi:hypothetical protein
MSQEALAQYWQGKLTGIKETLEENNFAVWLADSAKQAKKLFWDEVFKPLKPASVSFGGSLTVQEVGVYQELKQRNDLQVIDTYDTSASTEEFLERRRQALLVDLFVTSTNSLTKEGHLVNLDGLGNRVAALTFGPRHVALFVSRNKVVADLDEAISRTKEFAAPVNAVRLNRQTPCTKTMQCEDCKSPERICNTWTITEKSNPPQRVKIILINQDLGY